MKKGNIFWVSYSDLMTSLFFVMLVLFVVSIGYLEYQKNEIEGDKEEIERKLNKYEELQTSVKELNEEFFVYQPVYKRFKLNKQVWFDPTSPKIKLEYEEYLEDVGKDINNLLLKLHNNKDYKGFDIKYLVIIEGMASKDTYPDNFGLSYNRALAVYNLWKEKLPNNSILFDSQVCEIQISGSGTDGIREYYGDEEYQNQRILIHIVPKMGKISDEQEL